MTLISIYELTCHLKLSCMKIKARRTVYVYCTVYIYYIMYSISLLYTVQYIYTIYCTIYIYIYTIYCTVPRPIICGKVCDNDKLSFGPTYEVIIATDVY